MLLLDVIKKTIDEALQDIIVKGKIGSNLERDLKRKLQERLAGLSCDEWKREIAMWRLSEIVRSERSQGNRVVVVEAVLDDRGLVGASTGVLASVLEVGVVWDYIADLPLVPGSTVKGAVRSLLLSHCASLGGEDDRVRCLEAVSALLGWTESPADLGEVASLLGLEGDVVKKVASISGGGLLTFHDSHLLCEGNGGLLEPWVITPHYRDAETEYDAKPVPVEHVVLRRGLKGYFVVGIRRDALRYLSELRSLIEGKGCSGFSCLTFLAKIITATLSSGVGARTTRGYTRFRVVKVLMG